MNFKLKKSGFTLSEVMVTLALVGTLATLTLSTIGASIQQRARLAEFRSAYSKMEAALKSIEFDRGSIYACYTGDMLTSQIIKDYGFRRNKTVPTATAECPQFIHAFSRALGATHSCEGKTAAEFPTTAGCIPEDYPRTYKCSWNFSNAKQAYVFDNGMIFLTMFESSNTKFPRAFAIDINGRKGPNKWGQDIFVFALAVSETQIVNGVERVKDVKFIAPNVDETCFVEGSGKTTTAMIKESAGYK